MGLFKYPKSEEEDSFGEQLLKTLLAQAAGAAVQGGISGGLGDYFAQKKEGRAAERQQANQQAQWGRQDAQQETAKQQGILAQMTANMPDPSQKAGFLQAMAAGSFDPAATDEPQDPMGPQLPFKSLPKEMEHRTNFFFQEHPELEKLYREPKSVQGLEGKERLQGQSISAADERSRKRMEFDATQKDLDRKSRERSAKTRADAKNNPEGPLPPSKDPTFQMLKALHAASESSIRDPISGKIDKSRIPARDAAKKAFVNYALDMGMSKEEIARELTQPEPTGGATPAPGAAPAPAQAPQSGNRVPKAKAYLESKGVTGKSDKEIQEWLGTQDPAKLKSLGI